MKTQRSKKFDDITMGWGSDDLEVLEFRAAELALYWLDRNGLFTPTEQRVVKAMHDRIKQLGGISPLGLPS